MENKMEGQGKTVEEEDKEREKKKEEYQGEWQWTKNKQQNRKWIKWADEGLDWKHCRWLSLMYLPINPYITHPHPYTHTPSPRSSPSASSFIFFTITHTHTHSFFTHNIYFLIPIAIFLVHLIAYNTTLSSSSLSLLLPLSFRYLSTHILLSIFIIIIFFFFFFFFFYYYYYYYYYLVSASILLFTLSTFNIPSLVLLPSSFHTLTLSFLHGMLTLMNFQQLNKYPIISSVLLLW